MEIQGRDYRNGGLIRIRIEGERIASGFERDEFGMYRSDDAGDTWEHLSADPELHQRPGTTTT